MRLSRLLAITALAACVGGGSALAGNDAGPAAQQELIRQFPGVHTWNDGGRDRIFYGAPMTTAASPRLAAETFLAEHDAAFGVGALELSETWSGDVRAGKFWAFSYTQLIGGLPVDGSPGRVLVRNNLDGTWSVVYAAGLFAAMPEGGFPAMTRTAQDALNFVRGTQQFGALPKWSMPTLVAYQADTGHGFEAVRAWSFAGENPDLVNRENYTFFIDAATGALLEARDEVHHIDVFGFVKGYGSPGRLPDDPSNPPALLPINDIRVAVAGGNTAYTDTSGFFNVVHGGGSNVNISATFDTGHWCDVNDQSGTPVQSVSGTATPGQEAYLEFNPNPSQYLTAQVNGFIHTGLIHNFFRDRSSWSGMDLVCTTNVNIASTCNAYYSGSTINFYRAGGGCNNTAYSSVIAHEYGHYVVARLGLAQGAFGEGYGDCCGEMLYDSGVVGEHWTTNGNPLRDNDTTIRMYPCSGEVHYCGQLLAGVWWHMRENFGATYGSAPGLEQIQQLFVDWSLITTGGQGGNSAHPGTAIEVLTLDDDDGNLDNGTPNFEDICTAFELHGVDCPRPDPLAFDYPDGLPTLVTPSGGTTVTVVVTSVDPYSIPAPGTGVFYVDDGSGFRSIPMTELHENVYEATFPAIDCGSKVRYYFSADRISGETDLDPIDAPENWYEAFAAADVTILANHDFESDSNWTVSSQNLISGAWLRGTPAGDGSRAPAADFDGSGQCWLTGDLFGNFDVDGGPTRLTSQNFNIAGLANPSVSFAWWFYNDPQDEDRLQVLLSGDSGPYVLVEEYAHGGTAWHVGSVNVREYFPDATRLRVRFSVADNPDDSTTEAAIDAFLLADFVCGDGCIADFNGDGTVNTQDVLAFLNAWTAGDGSADINGDGAVNTQDVLAFLNLWNAGC